MTLSHIWNHCAVACVQVCNQGTTQADVTRSLKQWYKWPIKDLHPIKLLKKKEKIHCTVPRPFSTGVLMSDFIQIMCRRWYWNDSYTPEIFTGEGVTPPIEFSVNTQSCAKT